MSAILRHAAEGPCSPLMPVDTGAALRYSQKTDVARRDAASLRTQPGASPAAQQDSRSREMDTVPLSAQQQIRRITWIGMGANVLLALAKLIVGVAGASQAVIADAVHSLSDMSTDVAVLFGVRYWSAPPDDNHPYGHGRIEALVTAFIGLVLGAVALGLAYNALTTVREPHLRQPGLVAALGPAVSIAVKEVLYRWTMRVGRRARSSAAMANAWHHRSDALSSAPALVAVLVSSWRPEWAFVDHFGALLVSLLILKVAWEVLAPAVAELIDRGATAKQRARILAVASSVAGVREVHRVRARRIGTGFLADLHVLVDAEISVRAGHTISETVERELRQRGPEIVDVVIHVEPHKP